MLRTCFDHTHTQMSSPQKKDSPTPLIGLASLAFIALVTNYPRRRMHKYVSINMKFIYRVPKSCTTLIILLFSFIGKMFIVKVVVAAPPHLGTYTRYLPCITSNIIQSLFKMQKSYFAYSF